MEEVQSLRHSPHEAPILHFPTNSRGFSSYFLFATLERNDLIGYYLVSKQRTNYTHKTKNNGKAWLVYKTWASPANAPSFPSVYEKDSEICMQEEGP